MPLVARRLVILLMFVVTSCEVPEHAPLMPQAIVGTKAVIRAHGKDLMMHVTSVAEKVVTSELTDWNGQLVSLRHYYRGLYPIAGNEGNGQWEIDFDQARLEGLFPVAVGKATNFNGNMKDLSTGKAYDFQVTITVAKESPFTLSSKTYSVYVVDIVTEYTWNGKTRRKNEVVYYSPEFSMNMKGIMHEGTSQRYWRVVSLERPGQGSGKQPVGPSRPRSAGTVMI